MFDLDRFLTTSVINVNATDITFKDMRTGETYRRTIYRPGKFVTFKTLAEEMQIYGYQLIHVGDPGDIPGRMNWSDVFGKFIQEEGSEDDRSQL